jgi:glycerate-2-kinase
MIVNFKALTKKSSLREKALKIAEAGYKAIEIPRVVSERIKIEKELLKIKCNVADSVKTITKNGPALRIDLNDFRRVFLIGIGKGSALACAALAEILGKRLTDGIALDIQKPKLKIKNLKLKILTGTHPLPSRQNIEAAQKIIKLAESLKKDDLLITFICGGGSALLCGSEKELKYSQTIFKELTKAGADIKELNTARKHLSEVKGGNLAKMTYPATVVSLIVSDVPTANNDLSAIASGPTVYDKTTKKDAIKIFKKYLPRNSVFQSALVRVLRETPKDEKYFKKVKNILFLSNKEPILAMAEKAKKLGFEPKIYSLKLGGEAKNTPSKLIGALYRNRAVLAGGETTVTLKNQKSKIKNQNYKSKLKIGKGGRNMEAVLGAIASLKIKNHPAYSGTKIKNLAILSFASDGRDNTEAAGAIGDILTLKKAQKLKLNPREFLAHHNSFHFFDKTGDLIYAERKTFNIADLMLVLSAAKE